MRCLNPPPSVFPENNDSPRNRLGLCLYVLCVTLYMYSVLLCLHVLRVTVSLCRLLRVTLSLCTPCYCVSMYSVTLSLCTPCYSVSMYAMLLCLYVLCVTVSILCPPERCAQLLDQISNLANDLVTLNNNQI